VSGISQGAIYAFVGLSLTLIFRTTTVINFGHGELFMLSAFGMFVGVVAFNLPYLLVAMVVLIGLFLIGAIIDRYFMTPLLSGPHLSTAMMTIAIGYVLRGIVRYLWGRDALAMPAPFAFGAVQIGPVIVTAYDLTITISVTLMLLIFFLGFHKTTLGKLTQAVYQSPRGARLIGVNVSAFNSTMWGLGAAMAAIAGILVAPVTLLYPDMGANALIRGFAAMAIGGFGSLQGAVVGGLILGVLEQLFGAYINSALIDVTAYLVILFVLILRPNGLFGRAMFVRV